MQSKSDTQLLRDYADRGSEAAFAEIVRRHADLVYSAAWRQVDSTDMASDVAQSVFIDLARKAKSLANKLTEDASLVGWLYTATRFAASNLRRGEYRRQVRERQAMDQLSSTSETGADWERAHPVLDEAMSKLDDEDREAVLLRFFSNQDFHAIGVALGVSDDTAQKRVSRALERLNAQMMKRGVTTTAVALSTALSANAVQAAPAGLAAAISSAATLAGTSAVATTTATITKAIAMTTLQKTFVAATVAVLAGAGVYEARQAAQLRDQVQALQQQQAPLEKQVRQLMSERDAATSRAVGLAEELASAEENNAELLKLRGEVGALRAQLARSANPQSKQSPLASAREYYNRANTHYMNHEYDAQLEDLNKAIELDPNMAEAYLMRGLLYASNLPKERGGFEKAIADYTRCLEIRPNNAPARWNRANNYVSVGQPDQAISDWTVYIEGETDFSNMGGGRDKSIAGAYFWRGHTYQHYKRDYSKAIADYTAALQLNPNIEGAHRQRGKCYEILGETEKAQQDFAIEPKQD